MRAWSSTVPINHLSVGLTFLGRPPSFPLFLAAADLALDLMLPIAAAISDGLMSNSWWHFGQVVFIF